MTLPQMSAATATPANAFHIASLLPESKVLQSARYVATSKANPNRIGNFES
jgi:hypothetical protein